MNVNKRLGRLRQWGKEKMGGDKSNTTEEFKALEMEMNVRHEGMEKLHGSMNVYIKSLSKRTEGDSKDKTTSIAHLGSVMARHGEAFEEGNKFGECLVGFGQVNEKISKLQDSYVSSASTSWLDALERSLAQLKDYQNARKKLDSRRLAYDTSVAKMGKAKKEDFRAEEDLRAQKAKYEESTEDVYRRMQDIIEAENDNSADLYTFLEAELNYHDRCRELLLSLKRDWPLGASYVSGPNRSRSNTLDRLRSNTTIDSDDLTPPSLPFRSRGSSTNNSPSREASGFDFSPYRPSIGRTATSDVPSRTRTPVSAEPPISFRQPQFPLQLRPVRQQQSSAADENVFSDPIMEEMSSSPEKSWDGPPSSSPATSHSGGNTSPSRNPSWSTLNEGGRTGGAGVGLPGMTKKAPPPPPPPSRLSKPKPPPPPMKRSALSTTSVPYAA